MFIQYTANYKYFNITLTTTTTLYIKNTLFLYSFYKGGHPQNEVLSDLFHFWVQIHPPKYD